MYIAPMENCQEQELPAPKTQAQRTEAMKHRLIEAAVSSLVDQGYARTTAVEVCRRAGVTRGALLHHYDGVPDLLADALSAQFDGLFQAFAALPDNARLADWLQAFWVSIQSPKFKAVLEIWLAARNDPDATAPLQHAMDQMGAYIDPHHHPALMGQLTNNDQALAFYRTAMEAMFGLMLGRATSPDYRPLGHEQLVIDFLMGQAASFDAV